jgi:hypothetical protein
LGNENCKARADERPEEEKVLTHLSKHRFRGTALRSLAS